MTQNNSHLPPAHTTLQLQHHVAPPPSLSPSQIQQQAPLDSSGTDTQQTKCAEGGVGGAINEAARLLVRTERRRIIRTTGDGGLGIGIADPPSGQVGCRVVKVWPSSVAEVAGIHVGDVIVAFQGVGRVGDAYALDFNYEQMTAALGKLGRSSVSCIHAVSSQPGDAAKISIAIVPGASLCGGLHPNSTC